MTDKERIAELETELAKKNEYIKLHAGDCCSLSNESDMFRERAQDAEEELDKHQWVSVEDRLPESKQCHYAVFGDGEWFQEEWILHGEGEGRKEWNWWFIPNAKVITHWKTITLPE